MRPTSVSTTVGDSPAGHGVMQGCGGEACMVMSVDPCLLLQIDLVNKQTITATGAANIGQSQGGAKAAKVSLPMAHDRVKPSAHMQSRMQHKTHTTGIVVQLTATHSRALQRKAVSLTRCEGVTLPELDLAWDADVKEVHLPVRESRWCRRNAQAGPTRT